MFSVLQWSLSSLMLGTREAQGPSFPLLGLHQETAFMQNVYQPNHRVQEGQGGAFGIIHPLLSQVKSLRASEGAAVSQDWALLTSSDAVALCPFLPTKNFPHGSPRLPFPA